MNSKKAKKLRKVARTIATTKDSYIEGKPRVNSLIVGVPTKLVETCIKYWTRSLKKDYMNGRINFKTKKENKETI